MTPAHLSQLDATGIKMLVNLKIRSALAVSVVVCTIMGGCTSVMETRSDHEIHPVKIADSPEATANTSSPKNVAKFGLVKCPASNKAGNGADLYQNSIEDFGQYWIGYSEFDDQGWKFQKKKPTQMDVIQARLLEDLKANPQTDFEIITFVHGWHHSAKDDDCNVQEFRAMVELANKKSNPAGKINRKIVGLYIGWRGESLDVPALRYLTPFDRSNAADRVAKGDVRSLFALINKIQLKENSAHKRKMTTVVIGHSYGGLIAFHSLSPGLLSQLTMGKRDDLQDKCPETAEDAPTSFPNLLILINPAFEATRFESVHELNKPSDLDCNITKTLPPKIVVITADNDYATDKIFVAERKVLTLLEKYPPKPDEEVGDKDERESNTHAIGFIDRLRTHRLCLQKTADGFHALAYPVPAPTAAKNNVESEPAIIPEVNPPVWVVRAPPEIANGHDGFLYVNTFTDGPSPAIAAPPSHYLLDWLLNLDPLYFSTLRSQIVQQTMDTCYKRVAEMSASQ